MCVLQAACGVETCCVNLSGKTNGTLKMEAACSLETLMNIVQLHGVTFRKSITLVLNTHSKPRHYMKVTSQFQVPIALTQGKTTLITFVQELR